MSLSIYIFFFAFAGTTGPTQGKNSGNEALKVATINVRGLHDDVKRIENFKTLIRLKFDIIALQETHCTEQVFQTWKKEWPGESSWTKGKADSAGVAFLFKENLEVKILDEDPDIHARILRISIQVKNQKFQLINIYGHNSQNIEQSDYFFNRIHNHTDTELPIILMGDFNMM